MNNNEYSLHEFDFEKASDEMWCSHRDINAEYFQYFIKSRKLPELEEFKKGSREALEKFNIRLFYVVNQSNRFVAFARLIYSHEGTEEYKKNSHSAKVLFYTRRDSEGCGFAKDLFKTIINETKCYKKVRELQLISYTERGRDFAQKCGGLFASMTFVNTLYLEKIDWIFVEKSINCGRQYNPNTTILYWNEVPDDKWDDFMELYNDGLAAAPDEYKKQDITMTPEGKRNEIQSFIDRGDNYFVIVAEEEGKLISLTEINRSIDQPNWINQMLTVTASKAQGRKIASWLKCLLVEYISENFPEVDRICTSNHDSNAPMFAINKKLGFQKEQERQIHTIKI